MKNIFISLLTICLSFLAITFVLTKLKNKTGLVENTIIHDTKEVVLSKEEEKKTITFPNSSLLDVSTILTDYDTWVKYDRENIDLATDFIAIDIDGSEIIKKEFLEKLKTGNYIPIKLSDKAYTYQLYRINKNKKTEISKYITTSSSVNYAYFLKENTTFPKFSFNDLNGNLYTTEDTLGNILVIKCWFIQCTVCIEEFPKVNDLYDRYEGHDDIIFLSLAFDEPDKLKKFLIKKEFRYPVIPLQKDFMKNDIGIIEYPSHIIIDKQGNIKKIVNNVDSLILALDTMVDEDLLETEI